MLIVLSLLFVSMPLAQAPKKPDVSCEASGDYIGNAISPVFRLKIGPAARPDWTYTLSDNMFGQLKDARKSEYRGTYEIDGDLVIFTGKMLGDDPMIAQQKHGLRMGLNFGFPNGQVAFNRFFPDARGEMTYHRKWFLKAGGEWRPLEEHRLILPPLPKEGAATWEVVWKGERIRWGEDGKKTVESADVRLTYKRLQTDWYRLENTPEHRWQWLPGDLILERVKDKVVSVRESNLSIGDLLGFHPGYAESATPR